MRFREAYLKQEKNAKNQKLTLEVFDSGFTQTLYIAGDSKIEAKSNALSAIFSWSRHFSSEIPHLAALPTKNQRTTITVLVL